MKAQELRQDDVEKQIDAVLGNFHCEACRLHQPKLDIERAKAELLAIVTAARIDELEMAIHMKGKTLVSGVVLDNSVLDVDPNLLDVDILKTRLAALQATTTKEKRD